MAQTGLFVVTHNGQLPIGRGGTGKRLGYRVVLPSGGHYEIPIGGPMFFIPPPPPLPSINDLPLVGNHYNDCTCGSRSNPLIRKKMREGECTVVECKRCGRLMQPMTYGRRH